MADQQQQQQQSIPSATRSNGTDTASKRPVRRLNDYLKKKPVAHEPGIRIVLHGREGIGKTRFGCDAPDPVFICPEDGFGDMPKSKQPAAFVPNSWSEIVPFLRTLVMDDHSFKTVVFDTIDWVEKMIQVHVMEKAGVTKWNDPALAFGSGTLQVVDEVRLMLSVIDQLRHSKGMHVIFLCHTKLENFGNPEGLDYSRYELSLSSKVAGLLRQYCDVLLFAAYETYVKGETKKATKGKAFGDERVINTVWKPAWDAKNRHSLPEKLPLSWAEFWHAMNPSKSELVEKCEALRVQIREGTATFEDPARSAKVEEFLTAAGDDLPTLEGCLNSLTMKLSQLARQREGEAVTADRTGEQE